MQKIFVVEDDENIRELVRIALEGYQYEVSAFESAEQALQCLDEEMPDLIIFDWMLPGMDGMTAIQKVRSDSRNRGVPIIVLTAKDKEYDKVVGLDGGADDYITKPFGIMELAARIRSLLRRSASGSIKEQEEQVSLGNITIDTAGREVKVSGREVNLTYKEYELLMYLITNRERVVPREELLDELWDYNVEIETRTLDIHIRTLRQKLGEQGSGYIKTVRSVGYRFVVSEEKNI